MRKRYFTVEEANRTIPALEASFSRILQMRRQMSELHALLDLADAAPESEDFTIALEGAGPAVTHNRATLKALLLAVEDELDKVRATGCLVKSVERGLVDWYATRGGRDVFLCWKLGEKEVGYWHDTREGVRGRRPIEELYEPDEGEEPEAKAS